MDSNFSPSDNINITDHDFLVNANDSLSNNTTFSGSSSESEDNGEGGGQDCDTSQLYNVLILALFVFGTIGNIVSVAVMRQPALRRRAGSPALSVLIFVNTLGLFFNGLSSIDDINSTTNVLYYGSMEAYIGTIGCKLLRYLPAVIQLMGHWVVVYITAQRFIAVCLPKVENAFFLDRNAKPVFTSMFFILAATQLWRPYLDRQEPAVYANDTNGTLVVMTAAACTAGVTESELGAYIDLESFFYQLGLLFFLPFLLISVMNAGVILKLYQDYNRNRRLQRYLERSVKQIVRLRNANPQNIVIAADMTNRVEDEHANAFLEELEGEATAPLERKIRKATMVLLAVTLSFLLYITPHLVLLLYVRLNELFNGRMSGYFAFLRVCKALNVTIFIATISSADYIILQLIFDDMFRLELKFIIYRLFGKCFLRCQYYYIRERQLHRSRLENRCIDNNQPATSPGSDSRPISMPGATTQHLIVDRRSTLSVPMEAAIISTHSFYDDDFENETRGATSMSHYQPSYIVNTYSGGHRWMLSSPSTVESVMFKESST